MEVNALYFACAILVVVLAITKYRKNVLEEYYAEAIEERNQYKEQVIAQSIKIGKLYDKIRANNRSRKQKSKNEQMYNHLLNNVPNTPENRGHVKFINDWMKKSRSRYRLKIRWRGPKQGGYKRGGGVDKNNSQWFSVYFRRIA